VRVKSLPVIAFYLLALAFPTGASGQDADSGAGPSDVFRHAPRVGSADTSVAGVDVFRRTALRKERASATVTTDIAPANADSVVIDGARVALDTVHTRSMVFARPTFRRPAPPAAAVQPPVAVPLAAPLAAPPAAPVAVAAPAPVRASATPRVPVVAALPVAAPTVPTPLPRPAMPPAPVAGAAPVAAPSVAAPTVATRAPRTRRVISHAPLDSAQLAREIAELTREVGPQLASVNASLDSVRLDYQSRLDSIQRTADQTISDSLERRWLDSTIAVARWKNDSGSAHPAPPTHGRAPKGQTAAFR